ncbi:MAG: UDP-N-acetylmuramate--alanine ligase [bacterium]|nr:UDP-N-acetylmuramate--alanine ligase [bacterium]
MMESRRAYLMGIGGIAMANVAVLLKSAGWHVTGSDQNVYEPAASILRRAGIDVKTPYVPANLPEDRDSIVVVGNVQSRGHVEVEEALRRNLRLESFPGLLRRTLMQGKRRIVVAGTHGKSTMTACVTHLLRETDQDPSFLIGADPLDIEFGGHYGSGESFVIEGDEYDSAFFDKRSKFLDYFPTVLLLGRVEHDHLDIFPTMEEMLLSFRRVIAELPDNGALIVAGDYIASVELASHAPCQVIWVGESRSSDWRISARNLHLPSGETIFDFASNAIGAHNRLNAAMALAATASFTQDASALFNAAKTFRGIKRRLERVYASELLNVYDDFAHHPTAVAAAISALRDHHASAQVIAVFEPRSNTATRNLYQREFTDAFAGADHVVIGSIHRKEKIPLEFRLDLDLMIEELRAKGRHAVALDNGDILDYLLAQCDGRPQVILFMSNGSFDGVCRSFVSALDSKRHITA